MRIVSVSEMRRLEGLAIEAGVSGYDLMRYAGIGAAEEICHLVQPFPERHRRRFAVLCGKGNNGGDGWVVARRLHDLGLSVCVYSLCELSALQEAAHRHAGALPSTCPQGVYPQGLPPRALRPGTIVVDALLGTGVQGAPRGVYASTIQQVNESGLPVISLDVPSGLDADTGRGEGAIRADWTITMGFPKQGLFLADGFDLCGTVRVVGIGLPQAVKEDARGFELAGRAVDGFGYQDAQKLFHRRSPSGHKNTCGHVACLCGSIRYGGAGELCAAGALRAGAGLVTLVMPGACWTLGGGPAAVIRRRAGGASVQYFTEGIMEDVLNMLMPKVSSVVYGPGTGSEAAPAVLGAVIKTGVPLVIDADGLRLLGAHQDLLEKKTQDIVLTPHPGEMAALMRGWGLPDTLGPGLHERVQAARAAASSSGCVVLLKGRFTVVADPSGRTSVNLSGDSSLSTAGSGDVLAGVVGTLLGHGLCGWDAARMGAYLHGLAGELREGSLQGMVADDLPLQVARAWQELSPLA